MANKTYRKAPARIDRGDKSSYNMKSPQSAKTVGSSEKLSENSQLGKAVETMLPKDNGARKQNITAVNRERVNASKTKREIAKSIRELEKERKQLKRESINRAKRIAKIEAEVTASKLSGKNTGILEGVLKAEKHKRASVSATLGARTRAVKDNERKLKQAENIVSKAQETITELRKERQAKAKERAAQSVRDLTDLNKNLDGGKVDNNYKTNQSTPVNGKQIYGSSPAGTKRGVINSPTFGANVKVASRRLTSQHSFDGSARRDAAQKNLEILLEFCNRAKLTFTDPTTNKAMSIVDAITSTKPVYDTRDIWAQIKDYFDIDSEDFPYKGFIDFAKVIGA